MGVDYYRILGLDRGATPKLINNAYRRMAIKWHPDKNPGNETTSSKMFAQVAEAFEVLNDKKFRAKYDKFGEEGLKTGKKGDEYKFSGRTVKIFEEFFGTTNPFASTVGVVPGGFRGQSKDASVGSPYALPFSGPAGPSKMKTVLENLDVTLEELYNGCTKRLKIERKRVSKEGQVISSSHKYLTITVRPGWKKGTKITFESEGDEIPNTIPADRVFVVTEKPHKFFQRSGNDLIFTAEVSLLEALSNYTLDVTTLDGRVLSFPCNEIISPGSTKTIEGEGMPISKKPGQKGNLKIVFKIMFPRRLSNGQKAQLAKILKKGPPSK